MGKNLRELAILPAADQIFQDEGWRKAGKGPWAWSHSPSNAMGLP